MTIPYTNTATPGGACHQSVARMVILCDNPKAISSYIYIFIASRIHGPLSQGSLPTPNVKTDNTARESSKIA